MANQVLSDEGATALLNIIAASGGTWTLHLYATNVTPAQGSTVSSFTEAAGGGYARINLALSAATVSTVGGIVQIAWPQQTFTYTGTLTTNGSIYGFMIADGSSHLITAQALDAAQLISGAETPTRITPIIRLSSGTPT